RPTRSSPYTVWFVDGRTCPSTTNFAAPLWATSAYSSRSAKQKSDSIPQPAISRCSWAMSSSSRSVWTRASSAIVAISDSPPPLGAPSHRHVVGLAAVEGLEGGVPGVEHHGAQVGGAVGDVRQ